MDNTGDLMMALTNEWFDFTWNINPHIVLNCQLYIEAARSSTQLHRASTQLLIFQILTALPLCLHYRDRLHAGPE